MDGDRERAAIEVEGKQDQIGVGGYSSNIKHCWARKVSKDAQEKEYRS